MKGSQRKVENRKIPGKVLTTVAIGSVKTQYVYRDGVMCF